MSNAVTLHGDSLEVLKDIPDNSVDCVVTDPPYGLAFMGKKWDYDVPSTELWREVLRVLKPGGHLLSFGGTRTYHRMVVAIEDAGFDIRDQIMWIYGSGFPKSLDVSKAIDKAAGAEREVVSSYEQPDIRNNRNADKTEDRIGSNRIDGEVQYQTINVTAPATDAAKQWQGWGTALKPANEPIVLARKPLEKGLTVAQNVLKWGTGALNIDGTRIGTIDKLQGSTVRSDIRGGNFKTPTQNPDLALYEQNAQGRWPANVLFDEEAAAMLDEQSGTSPSNARKAKQGTQSDGVTGWLGTNTNAPSDSGGASRFFYVAKASKRERNAGLEGLASQITSDGRAIAADNAYQRGKTERQNHHPTVKPVKLMEYLIKLVCPPGGIVLDPFMGSGTTGVAAVQLDCEFIGIELEAEYVAIAEKRIANHETKLVSA